VGSGSGEWGVGRVGEWESGRVGEWESGRWESGRVGEWESGRVGEWRGEGEGLTRLDFVFPRIEVSSYLAGHSIP
jgi:hypothetical protein